MKPNQNIANETELSAPELAHKTLGPLTLHRASTAFSNSKPADMGPMGNGKNEAPSKAASVEPEASADLPFLTDILEIRKRVRQNIKDGAVTPSYEGNVEQAIAILNQALATELVCTLRYRNHYYQADGIHSEAVAKEFLAHSNEELEHADMLSKRIKQLNGEPDYNPANLLSRSHAEYNTSASLNEMIEEDLIAERIAVDTYREIARYFANHDPTTRRVIEEILAKEEEHAEEMQSLLAQVTPSQNYSASGNA